MNFNKMTIKELKDYARKNNIRGFSNKNKSQLVKLMRASTKKVETKELKDVSFKAIKQYEKMLKDIATRQEIYQPMYNAQYNKIERVAILFVENSKIYWRDTKKQREFFDKYNIEHEAIKDGWRYCDSYELPYEKNKPERGYKINKEKMKRETENNVNEMIDFFVSKNVSKVSKILINRTDLKNIKMDKIRSGRGVVEGESIFTFKNGDKFTTRSKIVFVFPYEKRDHVRYPTTFHDILIDGVFYKGESLEFVQKNIAKGKIIKIKTQNQLDEEKIIEDLTRSKIIVGTVYRPYLIQDLKKSSTKYYIRLTYGSYKIRLIETDRLLITLERGNRKLGFYVDNKISRERVMKWLKSKYTIEWINKKYK